jgi:hypothetical protein
MGTEPVTAWLWSNEVRPLTHAARFAKKAARHFSCTFAALYYIILHEHRL